MIPQSLFTLEKGQIMIASDNIYLKDYFIEIPAICVFIYQVPSELQNASLKIIDKCFDDDFGLKV